MRKLILLSFGCLFFLISNVEAQIDYSFGFKIPDVPQTLCANGNNQVSGIAMQIFDAGVNGQATFYEFFTSSPLVLSGPFTGSIPDGMSSFAPANVPATGVAIGDYVVTLRISSDPLFLTDVLTEDFLISVNDVPVALIRTPDGQVICDGTPILLVAEAGDNVTASYSWDPGSQTTSTISVNLPGSYEVTATNSCGSDTDTQVVVTGSSPSLNSFNCSTAADVGTITISANDPTTLGLDFVWYEDGVEIIDGGDFSIASGPTSSTLTVSNVADNHQGSSFNCEVSNDCGSFFTPPCVTLPVELLYFSGLLKDQAVNLQWATATESNSESFVVERSYDGENFTKAGEIPAAGFSFNEISYQFSDREANLSADQIYYRLRQVDFDEAFALSNVVTVRTDNSGEFQIEHVFASEDGLSFQYFTPATGKIDAIVYNLNGQIIEMFSFQAPEGFNRQDLTNLSLSEGFYLLHLSNGFKTDVRKFIR